MTILANKVKTKGISKQKILVTIIVLGGLLMLALFFGIFKGDNQPSISQDNEDIDSQIQSPDNGGASINQLLMEAETKKSKLTVESAVTYESKTIVPPIVNIVNAQDENPHEKAKAQYEKKQAERSYSSYSSRSLVFSSAPSDKPPASLQDSSIPSASLLNTSKAMNQPSKLFNGVDKLSALPGINPVGTLPSTVLLQTESLAKPSTTNSIQLNASTDYLDSTLQDAKSPFEIKAGSVIPALMINGLNSDLPGQVIAQVRENVYDSVSRRYLLIPQGTKLVGLYDSNVAYGQERILVAWNRLIYPDGSSINLKAMPGTDLEGYSGFYDEVDNKYWQIFGSSFILGVITGALQYSQNNTNANVQVGGVGIASNNNPTIGQTLSGSLGQQLGQTGLSITQKNLNVAPTLIVKPNYPFNIMLTADIVLRPRGVVDLHSTIHSTTTPSVVIRSAQTQSFKARGAVNDNV